MDKLQEIVRRNAYINSLNSFISSSKATVQKALDGIGWTEQLTFTENEWGRDMVNCSIDPSHRVLGKNLKEHEEVCRLRQQGYPKDCVPLPSPSPTTPHSNATVTLDKVTQAQVILQAAVWDPTMKIGDCTSEGGREPPQTSDRFFSDFTTDERRALYDYVADLTRHSMPQLKEFAMPAVDEARSSAPKTKEQLMAMERDAKRRRVRHRALKVHTRSKSYTQVVREVINNQMSAYEDWLKAYHGAEGTDSALDMEKAGGVKVERGEQEGKSSEMVWIEWDRTCNPHLFWQKVLEREKREVKRQRKRRERRSSSSSSRERRRESRGRKESDRHRWDRYERDRGRHDSDRRHRDDRRRDRYEDERYSRERERRRRGHKSESGKRKRGDSDEDSDRKRMVKGGRDRKIDGVRKDNSCSKVSSSTDVVQENDHHVQKQRPLIEGDLQTVKVEKYEEEDKNDLRKEQMLLEDMLVIQSIKQELDNESVENSLGTEQALLENDLLQPHEIKQEKDTESGENNVRTDQALLENDLIQPHEIKQEKDTDSEEDLVRTCQALLDDDDILQAYRMTLEQDIETDENSENEEKILAVADALLLEVKKKLDRGEKLDDVDVRLARQFLFKKYEMIGKILPSSSSTSPSDDDDEKVAGTSSSRPKKHKKKKAKSKKKKHKEKAKKKHKDKRHDSPSD